MQEIRKKFLDYDTRERGAKHPCVKCNRQLSSKYFWIHTIDGGHMVLHPEDEGKYMPDGGDCGFHPIGPDCAKKLGTEWVHSEKKFPRVAGGSQ